MATTTEETAKPARPARPPRPPEWRIRRHDENVSDPAVHRIIERFTGDDGERLARNYIKQKHPRGREVYLEHPDGSTEHYSADLDAQDHPDGGWMAYDFDGEY